MPFWVKPAIRLRNLLLRLELWFERQANKKKEI